MTCHITLHDLVDIWLALQQARKLFIIYEQAMFTLLKKLIFPAFYMLLRLLNGKS
jgi:hypothetical protein